MTSPDRGYYYSERKEDNNVSHKRQKSWQTNSYCARSHAYRKAQFPELFSTERTPSFVTQTVLAFCLERCLPQTVKDVSLFLRWKQADTQWTVRNFTCF